MPDLVASIAQVLDERIEVGGLFFLWGRGEIVTNFSFAKRGKVNAYRGMVLIYYPKNASLLE